MIEGASGTLTYENGDVYSGFFSKGKPNGLGELTFANGDHYAGWFKNGKPSGYGIMKGYENSMLVSEYKGKFK